MAFSLQVMARPTIWSIAIGVSMYSVNGPEETTRSSSAGRVTVRPRSSVKSTVVCMGVSRVGWATSMPMASRAAMHIR